MSQKNHVLKGLQRYREGAKQTYIAAASAGFSWRETALAPLNGATREQHTHKVDA